ncbi:MAG: glycoside hydrolase family 5 protein [candidate division FCPU426 bacterium]
MKPNGILGAALLAGMAAMGIQAPAAETGPDLRNGINFDHIFDPYQGMSEPTLPFGPEQKKEIESKLKASEFKQVAEAGFTHVRLGMGRSFIQEPKPPYALRSEGLAYLDLAVRAALDNGLSISLDMHQIPTPDLFHKKQDMKAFRVLWKGLAAHYASWPRSIAFELLNEPNIKEFSKGSPTAADIQHWRDIVLDLVDSIRAQDPSRTIIVSGAGWGGADGLMQLGKLDRPGLIYSFHFYDPMVFTHQGATWTDKGLAALRGVRYPLQKEQIKALKAKAVKNGYDTWPFDGQEEGGGKEMLRAKMEPIFAYAKQAGMTLYCGEFGTHKPYAPVADRAQWVEDVTSLLDENHVNHAMWAYHSGFDLADEKGALDPMILKALGLRSSASTEKP